MKKILAGIGAGIFILAGMMSCKDTLEDQFYNPEQTTQASIPKFFTRMIDNARVRPEYWNVRTFLVMHPGVYAQTVSYSNSNQRYQQQLSYIDQFWRDYYTPTESGLIAHMREIEKLYATLSDEEKTEADVFVNAAKVLLYDQTAQMVDLWGDIPFSEAGSINLTGGEMIPAKFDDAEEIYSTILTGLEETANYFENASLSSSAGSSFAAQDILLEGDTEMWRRYANSLRLRALMRISFKDETTAQTEVMEMLNDPASYPLIDEATYNILLFPETTYTDNLRNALTELNSHLGPEYLLDNVLKPASDPRLRALYDKNGNDDYYSMPKDATATEQEEGIAAGDYAVLDSATYLYNTNLPGIVMTSAEVNFLKAEAFERWGTTLNAQAAYEQAVTDAVEFSFYLNEIGAASAGMTKADEVTDAEITLLLASPSVAYLGTSDEKLAKIWIQKWVGFGFVQAIQAWAELRRTKYPVLTFTEDNSTSEYSLPSSRLVYPPTEKTYNADNYAAVASEDLPTAKVFWDVK